MDSPIWTAETPAVPRFSVRLSAATGAPSSQTVVAPAAASTVTRIRIVCQSEPSAVALLRSTPVTSLRYPSVPLGRTKTLTMLVTPPVAGSVRIIRPRTTLLLGSVDRTRTRTE